MCILGILFSFERVILHGTSLWLKNSLGTLSNPINYQGWDLNLLSAAPEWRKNKNTPQKLQTSTRDLASIVCHYIIPGVWGSASIRLYWSKWLCARGPLQQAGRGRNQISNHELRPRPQDLAWKDEWLVAFWHCIFRMIYHNKTVSRWNFVACFHPGHLGTGGKVQRMWTPTPSAPLPNSQPQKNKFKLHNENKHA